VDLEAAHQRSFSLAFANGRRRQCAESPC